MLSLFVMTVVLVSLPNIAIGWLILVLYSLLLLFSSYKISDFGNVIMEKISASKIVGVRYIYLKNSFRSKLMLKDVKHVLDIRLNLISTGRLED